MSKYIGNFIDKGDESELPHHLRSRPDKRTDLEYFIGTKGKLPRKKTLGCCNLCQNLNNKEICDNCTGWNCKFIVITLEEAIIRREKEKLNVK
jgi:hypothetical protein